LDRTLEVSALGLGCMNVTDSYGSDAAEADAIKVIDRAVELGATLFDTAEIYGGRQSKKLLGRGLKQVRQRVVIATKFGFAIRPGEIRPTGVDSRPEHIREVCYDSLKGEALTHNLTLFGSLKAPAARQDCTPAQPELPSLPLKGDDIVAILSDDDRPRSNGRCRPKPLPARATTSQVRPCCRGRLCRDRERSVPSTADGE
jgi:hypothetical protein